MYGQCMVAVYRSRDEAKKACRALVDAGISEDRVRLSDGEILESERKDGTLESERKSGTTGAVTSEPPAGGAFDWLFGSRVPEEDRRVYQGHLQGGGAAVSVFVEDAPSIANMETVETILERYDPVDLQLEDAASVGGDRQAHRTSISEGERVIPLPEEELEVGKRAVDHVQRIRTYTVEEPVERDVTLHDERTVIERRPATGAAAQTPLAPGAREYEIHEHHEEPVVQKSTRAGEELVIRKEGTDRTERVRDTVRKTKVEGPDVADK